MAIIEGIVANGVTEILKVLIPVIAEQIKLARGVKDDLEKLQRTLEMILAVIADAERRQVTEEAVRVWLRWLKDVVYDTDDLMDEFAYEALHRDQRGDRSRHKLQDFVSRSHNPVAFAFKMAKKIKNINRIFDEITKDMNRFQLQRTTPGNTNAYGDQSSEQRSRSTTSFSSEPEILGREDDKNQIINILTSSSSSSSASSSSSSSSTPNSEKVSFISLVGMGGLGKTTLAQLVYRDYFIQKQFEPKMWVHVSECFDAKNILINIMEYISKSKSHSISNMDVLVNEVREHLHGKKYLLVLDDVWNDDDQEQWDILKSALVVEAPGSKILITTRKDQVASIVRGNSPPYKLGVLSDDACWSMIEKRAFSPGGAPNTQEMIHIGKEIAKKCCGLPLAAKFLGGLLHSKYKESEWIAIRDDDIWNSPEKQRKILPVLKLSYNNLPSHLKQCFSYCAIFPKNWEINIQTLVHLWMAEGFLKQSDKENRRSVEDFGRDCFQSLAWSSFFQNFKKNKLGDIELCKMHDLVHDLAEDVLCGDELVSLKGNELKNVSQVRRLRLELDEDISAASLKNLSNAKKLRTLFLPRRSSNLGSESSDILSRNKNLRVLHVGSSDLRFGSSQPMWRSLSVLKHLRYLRLTCFSLRDDESIGKLYNLETLVLRQMDFNVQFLLSNIQSLRKLRYLQVSLTGMVELPDSVTSLSNLQTLDLSNCKLKVIPDSISGLKSLRDLNLSVNPFEKLPVSVVTLSNLETLDVNTCENLKSLPESVKSLVRLRTFDFKNCPLLKELPDDLGALTQLRYLSLKDTGIKVLPESCVNLNNLEFLNLFNCEVPKYVRNLSKLRKFDSRTGNILGAGELILLETLRYSVPKKYESEWNVGIEELRNLNFLESLGIWDLQNVEDPADAERADLKGKQNLGSLCLQWSSNSSHYREVFEALQPPTSLRALQIQNFMGKVFPDWMCVPSGLPNLVQLNLTNWTGIRTLPDIGFPSLVRLVLTSMQLLEELCYSCPSRLQYLEIICCERLTEIPSFPSLQDLRIRDCKSLTEIPSFPTLLYLELDNVNPKLLCSVGRSQTSLRKILSKNIEDLIYFPVSILQNNCKLHSLSIYKCNQLKGFGVGPLLDNMILVGSEFYSSSLQRLLLNDCPDLKFLPDFQGWTSLRTLIILECPQVKGSLTYDQKDLPILRKLLVDFARGEELEDPSTDEDLMEK